MFRLQQCSRYVSFCSFLASSNYYLGSDFLMTGIIAKRAPPTHYPSPSPQTGFVLSSRQEGLLKGGREVSEDLWRAGENPTIPINVFRRTMMTGHPSTHIKPTPQRRWQWRRQAPRPHRNKEQYLWWRRDKCGGSRVLALNDDTSNRDRLHLVTTTQHAQHFIWKPLLYSYEKLLKLYNVGARASGYGCVPVVLVLRWCGVPGICMYTAVVFSYECGVCGWE